MVYFQIFSAMQETFIDIKSLDMDARGVGHLANEDGSPGKVIFVEGALPGERVSFETLRKKKNWESGRMLTLQRASSMRVEPKCQHFGYCGGCSMQHLEPSAQVAMKGRVLEDNLWHIGKVKAEMIMRPMYGPTWDYRYRARLSVRHVPKKGGVLVGFHERGSAYVADITTCEILPDHVARLLVPLRELIGAMSLYNQVPQIEVAIGEESTVMVLRIMAPLSKADEVLLKAFADQWGIEWWLQTKGPDTAEPFYPLGRALYYTLPEFGIRMPFKPTDFTQVNHHINRVLVAKALRLLDVQPQDRVADLFCGLGNFTLPLATQARDVIRQDLAGGDVGHEGRAALVEADQDAALLRHVAHRQARAVAVVPGRAVHRAHDHLGLHLADVPQVVFQHAAFHRHLGARLQMLHRAAAAGTEMLAFRLDPHRRGALQGDHAARFPILFLARRLEADAFARQRAFDEDHLAWRAVLVLEVAHAAPVHVEGFDVDEDFLHGDEKVE